MNTAFDMRGFIENSLLEWDNHVAAVVIAGGCNLRCPYCHSWRYVTGVNDLERLDTEAVFRLLQRQRGWINGVVFTGGEPTAQPGLESMLRRVKNTFRVPIKLHTNGTRSETVKTLLGEKLIDCLALDYKAPPDERFFAAAGIAPDDTILENVRESFALAAASGTLEREYHTTLAPAFVDARAFADMAAALETGGTWFLQQYENEDCLHPPAAGGRRYSNGELDEFDALARERHTNVVLKRGRNA